MRQVASISLAVGLMWVGCSKEGTEDINPLPGNGSAGGDGNMGGEEVGALPGGDLTLAPKNEATEKLSDPNAAPVLAERDGKLYQVYEIAKAPYTGKVVGYHSDSTESSEKIYDAGVLTRHTEWHANGQKKMEAVYLPNGAMKTNYYDEGGNPVKAPVKMVTGLGRGLEWKTGAGPASIEIIYRGKEAELIKKAFGDPDEDQNGVWIYKGMKVKMKSGQIMTTVRFTISNDKVLSVSVEP